MAYYIDLFSPETFQIFTNSNRSISGFRDRQKATATTMEPGDKLVCYVTKLSRWVGILEVTSNYFIDDSPIFSATSDPFIVRFNVRPNVWLALENGIPIDEDLIWNNLSFTKHLPKKSLAWTSMVRGTLRRLDEHDGEYLEKLLLNQASNPKKYPLDEADQKKLKAPTVKTQTSKQVTVSIPENEESSSDSIIQQQSTQRDSIKIQALLAKVGERMNLKIWLPKSDRQRVLDVWQPKTKCLLDQLPLNYDDATLKTIENIDVLWIRGRSIVRAFEVEHTTSIYSGILRMADLMALQPNLNISAHIVAPTERKDKVLQEISRPVFAFLEKGPLSESCTFISYESIRELSNEKSLEYMSDTVLEKYEEYAEEAGI
jgi:predicted RNA-binding protein